MHFVCEKCGRTFIQQQSLNRHVRSIHGNIIRYNCDYCGKQINRKENLERHRKICKTAPQVGGGMKRSTELEEDDPASKRAKKLAYEITEIESALKKALVVYRIDLADVEQKEPFQLVNNAIFDMIEKLEHARQSKSSNAIKFTMSLAVTFYQASDPTTITDPPNVFNSESHEYYEGTDLRDLLDFIYKQFLYGIELFERNGSGWVVDRIDKLDTTVLEMDPLRASTYIPSPEFIQRKKAVLNIKNSDERCFLWSIIAALHPADDQKSAHRVYQYHAHESDFNLKGIKFPMAINQISKFENQNNVSVSIYEFDNEKRVILPVRVSKMNLEQHVDLLLLTDGERYHYTVIKSFSRLIKSQVSKHHGKMHFCRFCLHGFVKEKHLEDHVKYCSKNEPQRTVLPKNMNVKFTNIPKQLPAPFVIYADFECILEAVGEPSVQTASKITEPLQSQLKYQKHIPCSFAYKIVSTDPNYHHDISLYDGEDAASMFLACLKEDAEHIFDTYIYDPKQMDELTENELNEFENATYCHICGETGSSFVRDHCHITGKYRGPAHNSCNLNYHIKPKEYKIPVVMHNLRGYDSHLIVQAIQDAENVSILPTNMEKYISFTVDRLRFIDSYQFMNESLDELSKSLSTDDFVQLRNQYPNKLNLLRRKGVYPYDFMNSFDKFDLCELPTELEFYSKLNDEHISDADYIHAQKVWKEMNCSTLRDYHNVYLQTDVLLLADVFEKFRSSCLSFYGLDAAHYYTVPGFAWDAALKMTKVNLELLHDPDMHLFVEKPNGGISMISHRFAKANNPYLPNYDPSKANSYIMYFDANSLYSWAMTQYLPTSNFRWLTLDQINALNVLDIDDKADRGYIF